MWCIEDRKIKEHWDILAPTKTEDLLNMVAGSKNTTRVRSADEQMKMKENVISYLETVVNRKEHTLMNRYVEENAITHTKEGETNYFDLVSKFITTRDITMDIKKVYASGSLVVTYVQTKSNGKDFALVDIFKLNEHYKIIETWSAIQPIIPISKAANAHPHF